MIPPVLTLACLAACLSVGAATVSATSDTVRIDTRRVKACPVGSSVTLPYDVRWGTGLADASYGRITAVPTIDVGATNRTVAVATCTIPSGECAYVQDGSEAGLMRLSLKYYDESDNLLGEAASCDLAYQTYAAAAAAISVDSRTNSLQEVAEAGGPALLTFDRAWATDGGAAGVAMQCVRNRYRKNGTLESSVTNEIFRTTEVDSGIFSHAIVPGGGGTFTLSCLFFDGEGNPLDEPLTAEYRFAEKFGMVLLFK